jgi:hypothetical protein
MSPHTKDLLTNHVPFVDVTDAGNANRESSSAVNARGRRLGVSFGIEA